jgi:hypothetical protein
MINTAAHRKAQKSKKAQSAMHIQSYSASFDLRKPGLRNFWTKFGLFKLRNRGRFRKNGLYTAVNVKNPPIFIKKSVNKTGRFGLKNNKSRTPRFKTFLNSKLAL